MLHDGVAGSGAAGVGEWFSSHFCWIIQEISRAVLVVWSERVLRRWLWCLGLPVSRRYYFVYPYCDALMCLVLSCPCAVRAIFTAALVQKRLLPLGFVYLTGWQVCDFAALQRLPDARVGRKENHVEGTISSTQGFEKVAEASPSGAICRVLV